jgi:hypothetical protein
MPKSVIVAIAAVSIVFLERVVLGVVAVAAGTASLLGVVLTGGISVIILVGMIKRHRLAWQWGRILGLIGAILLTSIVISAIRMGLGTAAIICGSQAILLYIVFFMLGTIGAKEYFRLVCPTCNQVTTKGADFFFSKAKCKACNIEW